jgi:hypothetical protein
MYMSNFKTGDKVKWISKMTIVPHPEGKTDRKGEVLPVFRDKEMTGRIIGPCSKGWTVRPDWAEKYKDAMCGERYYDKTIEESALSLI